MKLIKIKDRYYYRTTNGEVKLIIRISDYAIKNV